MQGWIKGGRGAVGIRVRSKPFLPKKGYFTIARSFKASSSDHCVHKFPFQNAESVPIMYVCTCARKIMHYRTYKEETSSILSSGQLWSSLYLHKNKGQLFVWAEEPGGRHNLCYGFSMTICCPPLLSSWLMLVVLFSCSLYALNTTVALVDGWSSKWLINKG